MLTPNQAGYNIEMAMMDVRAPKTRYYPHRDSPIRNGGGFPVQVDDPVTMVGFIATDGTFVRYHYPIYGVVTGFDDKKRPIILSTMGVSAIGGKHVLWKRGHLPISETETPPSPQYV